MEIYFIKRADRILVAYEDNIHNIPVGHDSEFVTFLFRRFQLCPVEGYRLLDLFEYYERLECVVDYGKNN